MGSQAKTGLTRGEEAEQAIHISSIEQRLGFFKVFRPSLAWPGGSGEAEMVGHSTEVQRRWQPEMDIRIQYGASSDLTPGALTAPIGSWKS